MKLPSSHLRQARTEWEQTGREEARRPESFLRRDETGGGINGDAAFVTFDNALNRSKTIGLYFSHHRDERDANLAPPPGDTFRSDKVSTRPSLQRER